MIIHSIKDAKNKKLVSLLKKSFSKINDDDLIKNYHPDFSHVPGNFFFILQEGRYLNGNYFIIEEDNRYYGSAGWNPYTDEIALALTRAYVEKEVRGKYLMGQLILPQIIKESSNYKKLWVTCNEHNKIIYNAFERMANNKSAGLFNKWPDIYNQFVPIGKKIVNYTEQYVVELKRDYYE